MYGIWNTPNQRWLTNNGRVIVSEDLFELGSLAQTLGPTTHDTRPFPGTVDLVDVITTGPRTIDSEWQS